MPGLSIILLHSARGMELYCNGSRLIRQVSDSGPGTYIQVGGFRSRPSTRNSAQEGYHPAGLLRETATGARFL